MGVQAIGQRVRREEDSALLTGRGRYVDDVPAPNAARGYVLRSPHAHARIAAIDTERAARRARRARGADRRGSAPARSRHPAAAGPPPQARNGAPAFVCPQPLLAQDRVRYVGDPVAFIVAETLEPGEGRRRADRDRIRAAAGGRSPPKRRSRRARRRCGTRTRATRRSFTRSATRPRSMPPSPRPTISSAHTIVINRVTANSMEPRGCLAQYDRDQDRYTIRCTIQSVHATRAALADQIFKLPQHQFRVVCDNMGGGFGMKGGCYPGIRAVAVGVRGHRAAGALDRRAQRRAAERRAGRAAASSRPRWRSTRTGGFWRCARNGRRRSAPIIRPTGRRSR